jgi:DNA-binding XRE family transcriptional regulator
MVKEKRSMAFRAVSKLDKIIKDYIKKVSIQENRDITIQEVMEILGEYCNCSWTSIKQVKDRNMQPSIAIALRMAQFFELSVEDIFEVEEFDNPNEIKPKKVVKSKKQKEPCTYPHCNNVSIARGLCNKHYQQFRNHNPEKFKIEKPTICKEKGCENPYYAKGYCSHHYNKLYQIKRVEKI